MIRTLLIGLLKPRAPISGGHCSWIRAILVILSDRTFLLELREIYSIICSSILG